MDSIEHDFNREGIIWRRGCLETTGQKRHPHIKVGKVVDEDDYRMRYHMKLDKIIDNYI